MLNNQYHGITVEDLEKAASVRLFEKAAAAEGINLNELSESQVDELYSNYQQSSEENTMNEEIFDLFEKQAAYEGVDLEALSDDELAYVFNNFVGNLESELEDDVDYDVDYDEDDYGYDEEEEAYEKLAEAEILGRHMARAYMDELEKEAKAEPKRITQNNMANLKAKLKELATGEQAAARRASDKIEARGLTLTEKELADIKKMQKAKQKGDVYTMSDSAHSGLRKMKDAKKIRKMESAVGYGKRGLVGLGVAGTAYGAKKMMDKEAANEAIYSLAFERAEEFLKEGSVADYDGSTIDNLAIEVLEQHGYTID